MALRDHPTRLLELLSSLGLEPRAVAVERNGEVLPRARLGEVELRAGDRLEVVRFVQKLPGEQLSRIC